MVGMVGSPCTQSRSFEQQTHDIKVTIGKMHMNNMPTISSILKTKLIIKLLCVVICIITHNNFNNG